MYSLGLIQFGNQLRYALLKKEGEKISIEKVGVSETLPPEILSIKDLTLVTGIEGEKVLRRDLSFPLTSEKMIRKTLAFQLEPLLPFPVEQTLLYPESYPHDKTTFVVLWAVTKETAQDHLLEWSQKGIEPELLSFQTLAPARWARHFFPEKKQIIFIHDSLALVLDHGKALCAMHFSSRPRLELFLKQKYPLFEWIDVDNEHAIPIGLALEAFEKNRCQLRRELSSREKKKQSVLLKKAALAATGLTLLTAALSGGFLFYKTAALKQEMAQFHLVTSGSLEETVASFRQKVLKETKETGALHALPTVQEALAWISSLSTSIDLQHVDYEVDSAFKRATLTLEFRAESQRDADQFVKQLQQTPTFVEPTPELKWTSHSQGYKISFPLRKKL